MNMSNSKSTSNNFASLVRLNFSTTYRSHLLRNGVGALMVSHPAMLMAAGVDHMHCSASYSNVPLAFY
ncbi:hypothetical protein PCANC_19338 [Puccinia coronata f. sp. avenae]|uniref:Uncharacterized protein n=1 Tax=Puccinia coronata f. sp. avenae TaxID=200324 RepID=A0A2N5S6V5_9BASI|nr:hypothetical protein PCANC_19338 [Puccinia coronata f. sp. avenae]